MFKRWWKKRNSYESRVQRALHKTLGRRWKFRQDYFCDSTFLVYHGNSNELFATIYAPRLSQDIDVTWYEGQMLARKDVYEKVIKGVVMQERARGDMKWRTS